MSEMKNIACATCGIIFSIAEELYKFRAHDGGPFWCPNGHQQHFTGNWNETMQKLKEELQETRDRLKLSEEELSLAKSEIRQLKCEILKLTHQPESKEEEAKTWLEKLRRGK